MTDDPANTSEYGTHRYDQRARDPDIVLLLERQRQLIDNLKSISARLDHLEAQQATINQLVNRGLGAVSVIMFLGAAIGWMLNMGGTVAGWFIHK